MDDALACLRLQAEWGADEAIDPDPIDRMRLTPPAADPARRPLALNQSIALVQSAPLPAPASGSSAAERALAAASQAATVPDLRTALAAFDGCTLRDTASNLVFAEGDPAATTLLIGEPPGRDEDRGGRPFAGAEGQLLDQMLSSIGLTRAQLMLTPLLPWRPPGGRPVNAAELALCLPFLHRLITLVRPTWILLLGGTAARAILPATLARRRTTGAWAESRVPGLADPLATLVLPSLADMIKTPPLRRDAWAALRLLRRAMGPGQTIL